jgi:hypothetical protein
MRVFCYRNLHFDGVVWSLRDTKSGLVVDRRPRVVLKDVEIVVSAAGRARVLREKRKNVHAGTRGTRINRLPPGLTGWQQARYNPYRFESFVLTDGAPVYKARYAVLDSKGLRIIL